LATKLTPTTRQAPTASSPTSSSRCFASRFRTSAMRSNAPPVSSARALTTIGLGMPGTGGRSRGSPTSGRRSPLGSVMTRDLPAAQAAIGSWTSGSVKPHIGRADIPWPASMSWSAPRSRTASPLR